MSRLSLRLPADPHAAAQLLAWAYARRIELEALPGTVVPGRAVLRRRVAGATGFPWTCGHGHIVASAADMQGPKCRECSRAAVNRSAARRRAARMVS